MHKRQAISLVFMQVRDVRGSQNEIHAPPINYTPLDMSVFSKPHVVDPAHLYPISPLRTAKTTKMPPTPGVTRARRSATLR